MNYGTIAFMLFFSQTSMAYDENFYWYAEFGEGDFRYPTPIEPCQDYMRAIAIDANFVSMLYYGISKSLREGSPHITWAAHNEYYCGGTLDASDGTSQTIDDWGWVALHGQCPSPQRLDEESATCKALNLSPGQKGFASNPTCSKPSSLTGDPIDFVTGNNLQEEIDYAGKSLSFSRFYNSADGLWRSNYSAHLRISPYQITLVMANGEEKIFNRNGQALVQASGNYGLLQAADTRWVYSDGDVGNYTFDEGGRLVEVDPMGGVKINLAYEDSKVVVTSDTGLSLSFSQDNFHQPQSLSISGLNVSYTYSSGVLARKTIVKDGVEQITNYLHEDARDASLLTGIVDGDGVKRAAWKYDDAGRAISSELAGAIGKVGVYYAPNGDPSVTNELGKVTSYHILNINNSKLISSVNGVPSANCSASNSSYTYNDLGQVLTKTDANGLVTTYSYNDRGLEVSRVEASGTPLARTTTTEWDPSRFLKTKVVEPTRTTLYTYDAQGRPLSQQTTSN
ncbi:DUF6531 domain-containing protein [Pseudomonas sp. MWU13-2924]|uniref:DUF6531 domain-containing protein n=1 Tax=Pseudomonas sp. MWU13-2924 TaxID=2935076 RepID=UPI00200E9390|nr:DUF6531 domain-containing protein [Pseudomonas sp. MWU13-2924]